ncbi:MAG: hypothetical protein ACTSUE_22225 [Promethearchaeota archaeon]
MIECPVCKREFKVLNINHIHSKTHQDRLKDEGIKVDDDPAIILLNTIKAAKNKKKIPSHDNLKTLNSQFVDLCLFSCMQSIHDPTFSIIQGFLSSFGVKTDQILKRLLRNVKRGHIRLENVPDDDYGVFLRFLIEQDILEKENQYPITKRFSDAYPTFKKINNSKGINDFVEFITRLAKSHPRFITMGSSKIGNPPDFFSIKSFFIESITFTPSGPWRIV